MTKMTKPAALSLFLAMGFTAGALFFSCKNITADGGFNVPVPKDTSALAKINHFIPQAEIDRYKASFRLQNDSLNRVFPSLLLPDAEAFNKPALLEILKDPNCVGIRIYHGVKKGEKRDELRVILVGVDSQGNDLFITGGSALAADVKQPRGGLEYGQCPTCH